MAVNVSGNEDALKIKAHGSYPFKTTLSFDKLYILHTDAPSWVLSTTSFFSFDTMIEVGDKYHFDTFNDLRSAIKGGRLGFPYPYDIVAGVEMVEIQADKEADNE